MESERKEIREYTMGFGKVNVIGLLFIFPVIAVFFLPFLLIWGYRQATFFHQVIYQLDGFNILFRKITGAFGICSRGELFEIAFPVTNGRRRNVNHFRYVANGVIHFFTFDFLFGTTCFYSRQYNEIFRYAIMG